MKKIFTIALSFSSLLIGVKAQIVGTESYMKGNYVEIGISECGSFGTPDSSTVPDGFHFRTNNEYGLGFVADPDKDGWDVGVPDYIGDYFLPGSPVEGWAIRYNGLQYANSDACNNYDIPQDTVTYDSTNGVITTVWHGTTTDSLIKIKARTYIQDTALYFVTVVTATNISNSNIFDFYYARNVDPDNEKTSPADVYDTQNTIVLQQDTSGCGGSLVTGSGINFNAYLGLGSKNKNARVTYGNFDMPNDIRDIWDGINGYTSTLGSTIYDDIAISMCFKVDTLLAGDSALFSFVYILDSNATQSAMAEAYKYVKVAEGSFAGLDTAMCVGEYLQWTNIVDAGYDSIRWYFNGVLMANTSDTLTIDSAVVANAGTYRVESYYACGLVNVDEMTLSLNDNVTVSGAVVDATDVAGTNGSITISASGTVGTVTYSINGGLSFTSSNVFSGVSAGTYTLAVTDDTGCMWFKTVTVGHTPVDGIQAKTNGLVKVYPNPSNGVVNIVSNTKEDLSIEIYNTIGKLIGTYKMNESNLSINLSQGSYFIKVNEGYNLLGVEKVIVF